MCVNLHNSAFPSFNFFMFNEEDDTSINNENRKEFYIRASVFNQRF